MLPFLFVTAFGDIDQAVRLMRSGAGDYVTKPFDTTAFLAPSHAAPAAEARTDGSPCSASRPEMQAVERTAPPHRQTGGAGADHRRDRRRQGGVRPLPARYRRRGCRAVHGRELRRDPKGPYGE